ncbi:MAG: DUF5058 family protein, partial [Oscillospiraceae bacterium]|nr:DUF5058 family protein [Oscillospiraceae bacterium]
ITMNKNAIACGLGALIMIVMMKLSEKYPKIKDWNLTVAILGAMIITALI